jgi:16S rRNA (cytidine1402-2'-O)-methyltransferase
VARELTKRHEEFARGVLSELTAIFSAPDKARGEMVLLIDRTPLDEENTPDSLAQRLAARVAELEREGFAPREALKRAARELSVKRDEAYRLLAAQN